MTTGDRDVGTAAWPASSRGTGPQPPGRPARRPWWVWAVPFAALFGVLIARNRFLFATRLFEGGDSGANSILIEQAKHVTLLVGNYSREHFHHPGPAYMYVQAFGEWLTHDLLHVVPTAWNGQLLAVFALGSAFGAIAVGIVYGWTRSPRGAAGCFIVILGFAALHPQIINSGWMPYLYVLAFFVFLLAAASAAAGRADDLWALALAGWFLIHGQASFLFFVPVIAVTVLASALWPWRRSPGTAIRAFARDHPGDWIPALVISALFALPIALNVGLHWPGDFGRYFAYAGSARAGGHGLGQAVRYGLWFWWPHQLAWLVALALYTAAVATTLTLARAPLRRFLLALLGLGAVASLAFFFYAAMVIDNLQQYYIGYFYWSIPFLTLLVIATGVLQAVPPTAAAPIIGLACMAGVVALALVPGLRTDTHDNVPGLPVAVATLAARDPGRPIVISLDHTAWADTTGFLVQAERTQVRACVAQKSWAFMMTGQFICTSHELATGVWYRFRGRIGTPAITGILTFGTTAVTPVHRPS